MTAQFNPEVRALYENIIKRNVIPRDEFDYMPRYGGGRLRNEALCGNDGHYPSISQIENSNFGGAYGRASHPIVVGGSRKCGGVGVLKQARVEPFINELDMDYMPVSASHGSGRAPRLTKAMKQQILDMHPELKAHMLRGGKVDFKKLWGQIKSGLNIVSKAAPIISSIAPEEYKDTINKTGDISGKISGMGRRKAGSMSLAADLLGNYATRKRGRGFWQDFGKGFKQGFKETAKIAAPALGIASIFQPELAPLAAATGIASKAMGGRMSQARKKSVGHAKNQARGALIRQIMREKGMSLGQASSYIKQHNIPF
jgi:hypothetical protein